MTKPSVAAVIPVHNRLDLLDRLLATLRSQTVPFAEIILVDNLSGAPLDQACTIIRMGENAGFARAVNRGWRAASAPWIAILNSDVELDPLWAERLLAAAENASFATGTILSASNPGSIDGAYDLMSRAACAWRAGQGEPNHGGAIASIAVAPGTACIFRREVLHRLGGFEESFESYLEDVDLGLRCIRQGLRGVFVPDALAWHHGSATFGRWNPAVVRLISRNQLLLVARHYDRSLFRSCFWPILVGQLLWGAVAARHGALAAWLHGKWQGLRMFRLQGSPSPALRLFLSDSENEIRRRARDPYWRWYFRLTASRPTENSVEKN